MSKLNFGIAGPGMIAGVIADAIAQSSSAKLTAVSSRKLANAQKFVTSRSGVAAVEGTEALCGRGDVDAIYVATPTVAKEAIALAAIAAGKHVLVDKPFASQQSVAKMTSAAAAKGVVFMDATHFVHNGRLAAIQAAVPEKIGAPRTLHSTFYWPFSDRENIRFQPSQEPMTALGDMAWYSMRAIVEYLRPTGEVTKALAVVERDAQTRGIIRATGSIAFASGEVSNFDIGYTAGTIIQDLKLMGTNGVISLDDFVLDWNNSFAFKNPSIPLGYTYRTAMSTRSDVAFVATPSHAPQEVAMIDRFAQLVVDGTSAERAQYAEATLKSQQYLDALWASANS